MKHSPFSLPPIRVAVLAGCALLWPGLSQAASPTWLQCIGLVYQVSPDHPEGVRLDKPDGKTRIPDLFFIVDRAKETLAHYRPASRTSDPIADARFGKDRIEFRYADPAGPRSGWIERKTLNYHLDDRVEGATSWIYGEGNCVVVKRKSLAGNTASR